MLHFDAICKVLHENMMELYPSYEKTASSKNGASNIDFYFGNQGQLNHLNILCKLCTN